MPSTPTRAPMNPGLSQRRPGVTELKAIFSALQSGSISAEEAKRRLLEGRGEPAKTPPAEVRSLKKPGEGGLATTASGMVEDRPRGGEDADRVDDIAIVGLAGRFPKASDIEQFWRNLSHGIDCISEVPKDRWDNDAFFSQDKDAPGTTYCNWGGFIDGVDQFDPLFFNISPREAELIDPQERLFLEVVWEVLEQAGYTRGRIKEELKGEVGVFAGAMYQQYHAFDAEPDKKAMITLSSYGSMANRTSYFFDLNGPSIALDTMCSSAASAIHMACESLKARTCRMAIVGAANLSIHPYKYVALSRTQMLSSHRDRRSFADGDGFLPAEVVGAVLLKPLSQARADRDPIWAVIKSTAISHKGRSEGFSVPDLGGQVALLENHFAKAGIAPETIGYIETSASGTQAADAVEFAALKTVFGQVTGGRPVPVGSVKSNIGHAEASAGLSQLAKVVLQLRHRKLVPSIKADPPNPEIAFRGTALRLQTALEDWPRIEQVVDGRTHSLPRRAAISTLGAGGTNCHIILEEFVPSEDAASGGRDAAFLPIFVFSARSRPRLASMVRKLRAFFENGPQASPADVAYTLQVGREEMEHRLAVVAGDYSELVRGLRDAETLLSEGATSAHAEGVHIGAVDPDVTPDPADAAIPDPNSLDPERLRSLAERWVAGAAVDWKGFYARSDARIVALPSHPFLRKRYWLSQSAPTPVAVSQASVRPAAMEEPTPPAPASRQGEMSDFIRSFLTEALALAKDEDIDDASTFLQLGADSIVLLRLARKIETDFGVKLKSRDLVKYRTISALSEYLAEHTGQAPAPVPG